MSVAKFYFSAEGRATRFDYWIMLVLPYVMGLLISIFVDLGLGTYNVQADIGLVSGIYMLATIWPLFVVCIRRCHDRNRPGAFVLIGLIPIVSLWLLVELGFLRGTRGSNRYGPDPLDRMAAETT